MRLFCSFRSRIIVTVFLALATISSSHGQDRSAVATKVGQPTLIVSTSKIDQLMSNMTYLMRAVNQPEIGGMVTMTVNGFSKGLDRNRPIGVAVTVNGAGNPSPIVMLPVSDLKSFLSGLAAIGEPEDLGGGLYTMDIGPKPFFAKQLDNWLVVAEQESAVNDFKQVPSELLQTLSSRYDLGIKLDVQSVPTELRDTFIGQMKEGYERANAQQIAKREREIQMDEAAATTDGERAEVAGRKAGAKLAQQIQANQMEQLEDMVRNTKQVVVGLASDSANKQVYLELATEFLSGSKMDAQIARSATVKTDFAGIQTEGQAVSLAFTNLMDPSQIPQFEQTLSAGFDELTKALTKIPNAPVEIADIMKEVKLLLVKSIQEGIIDGAASVTFQSGLNIVTASRIADGKQLAIALQKLVGAVKQDENAPQIKFNAYNHQGAAIHLGSVKLPRDADEVMRKIFSDTPKFAIATGEKGVTIAIGSQAEENLKATLDRVAKNPATPGTPMDLKIELGPLLEYIQTIKPSPVVEAMIQGVQDFASNDMLTVRSKLVPHGAVLRITIEEGVLRAIGAGAKAGQGNRRGGF